MTDLVPTMLELLPLLGFTEQGHRWTRIFEDHERYALTVDLNRQTIDWGSQIEVGDSTTSNLAQAENLVVLECVCRLLQKGYKPASLVLEQRWQLGRTRKGGKCDIGVRDHNGDILVLIEGKTWGAEYDKEFRRMRSNGGQLFSYLTQDTHVRFLCLYASTVESGAIRYENAIVGVTDDPVLVASADAGDTSIGLGTNPQQSLSRRGVFNT